MERTQIPEPQRQVIPPEQIRQLQALASTIRYGAITLVFQDGCLVQIEKSEKFRITLN